MNYQTYVKMQEFLVSGTPLQKEHARFRLSQPDAVGFVPEENNVPQKVKSSPEYPSLMEQAKNAVVAAGKAIASGFAHVSKEEQERRLSICYTCEYWDASQGRCSKCGCFGTFKTWLATQKCPVDKW